MSCQFTKFAYFAVKLRHVVAYGYYLKLFIWIHVWIALNKFNHCYQLFNHVLYLDIYWSISDTAGLLFYLPVNNSGWTCYYQLQRFLFHLGLHLVHSINASCSVSTHDLLLPTTTITILIMGFNSHWNSVNMWLTTANYQDNNSHRGLHFVLSAYTHLPRYPFSSWLISYSLLLVLHLWLPFKLVI